MHTKIWVSTKIYMFINLYMYIITGAIDIWI